MIQSQKGKEPYKNESIQVEQSIKEKRGAHQEGGKREKKWHKFNAPCLYHQFLEKYTGVNSSTKSFNQAN